MRGLHDVHAVGHGKRADGRAADGQQSRTAWRSARLRMLPPDSAKPPKTQISRKARPPPESRDHGCAKRTSASWAAAFCPGTLAWRSGILPQDGDGDAPVGRAERIGGDQQKITVGIARDICGSGRVRQAGIHQDAAGRVGAFGRKLPIALVLAAIASARPCARRWRSAFGRPSQGRSRPFASAPARARVGVALPSANIGLCLGIHHLDAQAVRHVVDHQLAGDVLQRRVPPDGVQQLRTGSGPAPAVRPLRVGRPALCGG